MKKIFIFTLTLLVCLSTLVSCAQNALLNRQGGLYDEKEQIYYSYAPMSVEAISYSPKAHIVDAYGYTYHPVYDMKNNKCSTSDLLYEPDGHTLIYNSEMGFPTILEFEASSAIFYISGDSDQRLSSVDDAAETVKLTEVFRNPSIEYPGISATDLSKNQIAILPSHCIIHIVLSVWKLCLSKRRIIYPMSFPCSNNMIGHTNVV